MHYAALAGRLVDVQRLIADGSDINAGDRQGTTPLHLAVQEHQVDVVRLLLGNGASTTIHDRYGNTALWTATFNSRGRGDVISLLLAHGADPDFMNLAGASPRSLAASIGNYDVSRFFVDLG